eukprot:1699597-Amphidinium_carterae.2
MRDHVPACVQCMCSVQQPVLCASRVGMLGQISVSVSCSRFRMEALLERAEEVRHVNCISLLAYSTETWLCHELSGERLLLDAGQWELHVHPVSGFAALRGICAQDTVTVWANDLLKHTVYVHKQGPAHGQWLHTQEGRVMELASLHHESVCRVLSFRDLHGEEVHLRVYGHRVLTGKCVWAFTLTPLVGFMWGACTRQRGWIAKRVGSWQSRCLMLGAEAFHLRQSTEGQAVSTRLGAASRWLGPIGCEDDWTMPTSTLLHWLAVQTCSAKGSTVRRSDTCSYPETLLHALLARVLPERAFMLQLETPPVQCSVRNLQVQKAPMLASLTVVQRRLLNEVLAPEGDEVPVARLLCVLVRALTLEKRKKPQRELLQRVLGGLCFKLGVLVDLHLQDVLSCDLDMIPIPGGSSSNRGRKVSRTVRLARAKAAVHVGDKRAFSAGAHWQQRKRRRIVQGSAEHVQTDKEGIRDAELRAFAYLSRLRALAPSLHSVSLCTDGTRSASGKEVLTFALASSCSREAMWLPVQVTIRENPTPCTDKLPPTPPPFSDSPVLTTGLVGCNDFVQRQPRKRVLSVSIWGGVFLEHSAVSQNGPNVERNWSFL